VLPRLGGFYEPETDTTYICGDIDTPTDYTLYKVNWLRDRDAVNMAWVSKEFLSQTPRGASFGQVEASDYPLTLTYKVDGVTHTTSVLDNMAFRLPAWRGTKIQVGISGVTTVSKVVVTNNRQELDV
jgi:hypothetical protein